MNINVMSLTLRDRRALAAGAATIALLLVVGRAWPAWRHWQGVAELGSERAQLDVERQEGLVRVRRALHDSLVSRAQRIGAAATVWLGGDSPAAGAASLAALVSDAATRADVTIGSLSISTDSIGSGPLVRVRVRANASGDISGVAALLAALEHGPARLQVRALSIQSPDVAAPGDRAEVLQADLIVEGAWKRPAWMPQ